MKFSYPPQGDKKIEKLWYYKMSYIDDCIISDSDNNASWCKKRFSGNSWINHKAKPYNSKEKNDVYQLAATLAYYYESISERGTDFGTAAADGIPAFKQLIEFYRNFYDEIRLDELEQIAKSRRKMKTFNKFKKLILELQSQKKPKPIPHRPLRYHRRTPKKRQRSRTPNKRRRYRSRSVKGFKRVGSRCPNGTRYYAPNKLCYPKTSPRRKRSR